MKFEHGKRYTGTIRLRDTHRGMPVKPKVKEFLEGKTMVFTYCWACEDDEQYPGEYAMQPDVSDLHSVDRELFKKAGTHWIASGDVNWLEEHLL